MIEIDFTVRRISHSEEFRQFAAIVNKSCVSEQTFELKIETGTILTRYGLRAIHREKIFKLVESHSSPAFYCSYNGCYPQIEIVIIDDDGELYNFFL